MLTLAAIVSGETAGTAGMVALALLLAGIVRDLVTAFVAKRNGKKGNPGNPGHSGITKAEIAERDKTRKRVWQLYQWNEEARNDRKDQTKLQMELVALAKSQKDALERIERRQEEAAKR